MRLVCDGCDGGGGIVSRVGDVLLPTPKIDECPEERNGMVLAFAEPNGDVLAVVVATKTLGDSARSSDRIQRSNASL
jgi:hypothetical protein